MNTDLTLLTDDATKWDDKFDRIVKHYRDRRPDDDPKRVKLSKPLEKQLTAWITIHGLLSTGRYPKTAQQINIVLKTFPDFNPRTARNYLEDTKRFFAVTDEPNLAYERVMIIDELRDNMRLAKRKGDLRSLAALTKIYIDVIGANKPEQKVENRTIINILNYNPEQLGGQVLSDEALDKMIARLQADDTKKQEELFDDYTDVSTPEA